MTREELIVRLKRDLMDLATNFSDDNFEDAVDDAETETGWSLPQTRGFKLHWIKERAKRHLFYFYLTGNLSENFQYEQVHLEDQFQHFQSLVAKIDKDFEAALAENIAEFANVSAAHLFGTKIDAGFKYNSVGEDVTYTDKNQVIFNPSESDD